jgi:amphi-Trp domain-containing protein
VKIYTLLNSLKWINKNTQKNGDSCIFVKNKTMEDRDVEKTYTKEEFVSKLRRLADCIEKNENFRISVAGEALYVPDRATFSIEHERNEGSHELEFQVKWED